MAQRSDHQQIAAKTGIILIDYGIGGPRIARPTGITITDCMTDMRNPVR